MIENNTKIESYAGFTIGPIYEVLSSARKTRELWFASYFFSWFMEEIIKKLFCNENIRFITPYVSGTDIPNISSIGKYHDRFILRSCLDREELFEDIQKASDETLDYFIELIDSLVNSKAQYINGSSKKSAEDILKDYIQRNFVVLNSTAVEESKVVETINRYLDSMEENRYFKTGINEKTCFVCKTLPAVINAEIYVKEPGRARGESKSKELCPLCFIKYYCLMSDEVKKKIGNENFKYPSVLKISAVELLTEDVEKEISASNSYEEDFDFKEIEQAVRSKCYGNNKEVNSLLKKSYFKYFAIIQSDGDNLGKVLDRLDNFKKIEEFSKSLFDFAEEARKIIEKYKGYTIYAGGDDILALAPVAFKNSNGKVETVIDLAIKLSKAYREFVGEKYSGTTLSIGVNVAYYKFPLSIALKNARSQLFNKAKSGDKNSLAVLLTKHSGHQIEFKFKFDSKEIDLFSKLLSGTLVEEFEFPNSMHHNLSRFKKLITYIPDKNRLEAFFENNFNEPVHRNSKYSQGIKEVENYFKEVMFSSVPDKRLGCVEDILSKLAFIKFLRGKK